MERRGFIPPVGPGLLFHEEMVDPNQAMKEAVLV